MGAWMKIVREIDRINRQAEREQIRRQKEYNRIQEANRKAYEKQQKENYINDQQYKADKMTKDIQDLYEIFKKLPTYFLGNHKFFSFELLKQKYIEKQFVYNAPMPIKSNKSESIKIPKESKLENHIKFLKNRRLSKIQQKEQLKQTEDEEYNRNLEKYNNKKHTAYLEYEKKEQIRKNEIEAFNKSVDEWKESCIALDSEALEVYFNEFIKRFNYITEDKIINKTKMDFNNGKLIYEVYLKKEEDLFPCEGYRYYKQKDIIEPIQAKKNTINSVLKDLIPNVAITLMDLIYKNDELNIVNEMIVNVYYERKCCSSLKLLKDEYIDFNLTDEDNFYYVYDHYMKNYKVLSTGVKPYESIYMDLV